MIITILVYFLAGNHYYVPMKNLDECLAKGSQLVSLGTIQHFQCATVQQVQ